MLGASAAGKVPLRCARVLTVGVVVAALVLHGSAVRIRKATPVILVVSKDGMGLPSRVLGAVMGQLEGVFSRSCMGTRG